MPGAWLVAGCTAIISHADTAAADSGCQLRAPAGPGARDRLRSYCVLTGLVPGLSRTRGRSTAWPWELGRVR